MRNTNCRRLHTSCPSLTDTLSASAHHCLDGWEKSEPWLSNWLTAYLSVPFSIHFGCEGSSLPFINATGKLVQPAAETLLSVAGLAREPWPRPPSPPPYSPATNRDGMLALTTPCSFKDVVSLVGRRRHRCAAIRTPTHNGLCQLSL
jgi:hypothetical protein